MNRINIRKINELNVLREIFNKAPTSRAAVTSELGLTKSTVYSIFTGLQEAGFIYDIGQGSSTRSGGRKPALTNFNMQAGYTINTKINRTTISCMLNWLDGSVISYEEYPVSGEDVSQYLLALYDAITAVKLVDQKLLGISVAIYGVVHNNRIIKSTLAELVNYNLAEILQSRFNVPVVLENEANLAAVYIRDFTRNNSVKSAIAVSLLDGIGAGIIIDGHLYTGTHSEAGEIGHALFYGLKEPVPIETLCSDHAVVEQLNALEGTNVHIADIRKDFDSEKPEVMTILNQFCLGIGMALQNLVLAFDPDEIVLSSAILQGIPELLIMIKMQIQPFAHKKTEIILADNPNQGSLLGGSALIAREILKLPDGELVFRKRNIPLSN